MDSERVAKFPFLSESRQFVEESGADIADLVSAASYEPARTRGVKRIMDALESTEVSYVPMVRASDYDRLMEVLSYPYAKMIVASVDDRFLTKRYALAEAARMNRLLAGEDHRTVIEVSEQLGVVSTADADGIIRMKFTDYLRLADRLKAVEWKLINTDIHRGQVDLPQDRYSRLMQNAIQDKIESEFPMAVPDEFRRFLKGDVTRISMALEETKARLSPTGGERMRNEFLPPCILHIMDMSRRGLNLPHSARFALVTFLYALGNQYDDIIRVFAESPDFNEDMSGYQIRHIIGEGRGRDAYTPPTCATMRTEGLCCSGDDKLCQQEWMNHPLSYYRAKMRGSKGKGDGVPQNGREPGKERRSLLPVVHPSQIPPCYDGALDGRQVPDDREPEHHDLHPAELESEHLEGPVAENDRRVLNEREQRGENDPVSPPEQTRVQPGGPYGLSLGAHVRREQHTHQSQHAQVRVAPCGAERHPSDHEHIRVPVEDVIQVVALGSRFARELGDLSVQCVEVPRHQHHGRAEDQHPIVAVLSAEPEHRSARQSQDQTDPGYCVRIDVYEPSGHWREREVHARPLAV